MVSGPLDWLGDRESERIAAGLRRSVRHRNAVDTAIDLASNDYLGLARDPRVIEGATDALRIWGAGSTGSRLVTGSTKLHAEFEEELASFCGVESALVFSSGYTANLGVVTALTGPGSLIVSDQGAHASLVDACRLSRARVTVVPHFDLAAFDEALAGRSEERALVLVDSVGSTDGDLAPLRDLYGICRRRNAVLLTDEAHGLGVRGPGGRGLVAEAGLAGEPDLVATVTMSKSLGSQGGAVLGTRALTDHLVDSARSFIFDTGLAPAAVGAALTALRILQREPDLPRQVLAAAGTIAAGRGIPTPTSAVVSIVLGEPERAVAAAARLAELGIRAGCFRPPSVPPGTSRLRLTAHAALSDDDLQTVRDALDTVLGS